jgi:phosphoribosylformylglycinamidine (FGAM) synthase-like amidotransferase family enzyme
VHIQQLLAEPQLLDRFAIIAVPGGFAYGDDISSGRVLAQEIRAARRSHPAFVDRGGLVLGICNGFQVLVRLGLLPCTRAGKLEEEVTLTHNLSNHYECRWVTLKSQKSRCVFLPAGLTLRWPAAHGEGRLVARDDRAALLLDEGYAAFALRRRTGQPTEPTRTTPTAPRRFAGLTDKTGRVLGVMPHPDRSYLPR